MKLFRRSTQTRDEALIERYNGLRRRMTSLQGDYADLLRESKQGRGTTPHARKSYSLALGRKKEIDAVWKEIQRMGPKVGEAHVRVARKELKAAKGPAAQLEKMKVLHTQEEATVGTNWGKPPSRLKRVIGAIRRPFTGRRKAA